jgi:hypothetical protein
LPLNAANASPALRLLVNLNKILDDEKLALEDSFSIEKDHQLTFLSMDLNANFSDNADSPESPSNPEFETVHEATKDIQTCDISKEAKRNVMRQFLDLKRLLDKEGSLITSESVLQKRFFSKVSINIAVLIRALKVIRN